jgi:lysozyme
VIINAAGIGIIKEFEGWRPLPYRCPAGVPTIGWGSTRLLSGARVPMDHPPLSVVDGEILLARLVNRAAASVRRLVRVPLTENQHGALVSWAYNVGSGNLQASTLRRKLNRSNYAGAADEFPKWRKAGGRILAGLVRRREIERCLFLKV